MGLWGGGKLLQGSVSKSAAVLQAQLVLTVRVLGKSLAPGRATSVRGKMLRFVLPIHLACANRLGESRICTK